MTKNKKIKKVDTLDKYRVLRTEVLPYELPFTFNNDILHQLLRMKINHLSITTNQTLHPYIEKLFEIVLIPKSNGRYKTRIPYEYTVLKKDGGVRVLSVMHPASQVAFCEFYERYANSITTTCCRSPISIRSPKEVASKYYNKRFAKNAENFLDKIENNHTKEKYEHFTSFFSYRGYQYLFKFFSSDDCINSERRFSRLMTFDISKCFPSIYTHTITWALRGKNFGRENTSGNYFEGDFDKLMQSANGSETNGILVGPEISRIFAEIIFQRVDLNVIDELSSDQDSPLILNKDYALRRYVDDCFLYYHDAQVGEKIFKTYEKKLQEFRLYINDAKTKTYISPFMSNISMAKHQISKLISLLNDKLFEKYKDGDTYKIKLRMSSTFLYNRLFKKVINEYKYIIKSLDIKSSDVDGILFSSIINEQFTFLGYFNQDINNNMLAAESYLNFVLELSFYFYSHDIRVRTTEYMGYIISSICELFNNTAFAYMRITIKQKIFNGLRDILSRQDVINNGLTIDVMNLLILNKLLGNEFAFDLLFVYRIIEKSDGFKKHKLTYFQITNILLYFEGIPDELDIVVCDSIHKILNEYNPYERSESVMLLFDLLGCLYISEEKKLLLITDQVLNKFTLLNNNDLPRQDLFKDWSSSFKHGFTNWKIDINFMRRLLKKEKSPAYCE